MNLPQKKQKSLPLQSLREIIDHYDFFIFDLWGVVHNGKTSFPGAIEILTHLKTLGKPVYFLSNAPRRTNAAKAQLVDRGVPLDLYTNLFTSGEDTFEHLRDRPDAFYKSLGSKLYHMGPDKDKSLYDTLENYTNTPLEDADFILNTGTLSFEDTLEMYVPELEEGRARKLPMICANPDLIVLFGESEALCAGRIAKEYEKMGGTVRYHGKPFVSIYQKMFERMHTNDLGKILMIGDSLRTDIKGANNAGIDSIFITSGIHQLSCVDDALSLYDTYDAYPTYVMEKVI